MMPVPGLTFLGSSAAAAAASLYTNPYAGKIGVTTHVRTAASADDMVTIAKRIKSFGITWIREDISWSATETPSKGTFVWTVTDNLMSAASQAGLNVLPVVSATPLWASGNADFYVPPTTNQDYADFILAVWQRYGPGGAFWTANPSLTPAPLSYIELWNEPFGNTFFHGSGAESSPWNVANGPSPAKYAGMCKAVGTTMRASAAAAKLLICGEPYGNNPGFTTAGFFAAVLAAEPTLITSNLFDGYAIHPYTGPFYYSPWDLPQGSGTTQLLDPQGRFDKVIQAARQLAAAGGTGKEVWVTEFGWKGPSSAAYGVGEDQWADNIVGGARRLLREWGVTRAFIYTLDDLKASAGAVDDGSLLKFSSAGQPGTVRKPLTALQKLIASNDGLLAYRDEILADRPVLYTRLAATAPLITDLSATGIQNIALSATGLTRGQPSLTTDPYAQSTTFDGTAGAITVPNHAALNAANLVTLEAWIKFGHAPSGPEDILRKMSQYHLQTNSNAALTVNTTSGSNQVVVTSAAGNIPATTGYGVSGAGIQAGSTVLGVIGTTLTLSLPATATATGVTLSVALAAMTFGIYQAGAAQGNSLAVAEGLDIAKTWHVVGVYDGLTQYLFINGVLRKSVAKTASITGTVTSGSKIVTAVSAPPPIGAAVTGSGIPAGAWVTDVGPGTFEISANGTGTATGTTITVTGGNIDVAINPLGIGWRGVSATGFFNGQLQEAAVYNYALSPRRIAEHYQAGVAAIA